MEARHVLVPRSVSRLSLKRVNKIPNARFIAVEPAVQAVNASQLTEVLLLLLLLELLELLLLLLKLLLPELHQQYVLLTHLGRSLLVVLSLRCLCGLGRLRRLLSLDSVYDL